MEYNSNLDLLYALFNPYLFQDAKNNIDLLDYYYKTNMSTSGNMLVQELLGAIRNYSYDIINIPLFQSILMKTGKNPAEQQKIMSDLMTWKSYGKEQISPARQSLKDILVSSLINIADHKFPNNPSEYYNYLKSANFSMGSEEFMSTTGFDKINIEDVLATENQDLFVSPYGFMNEIFPENAVPGGQMVVVSMLPGTGKSLFMQSTALKTALDRIPCLYIALGDMNLKDFIVRMGAIMTGQPFREVTKNIKQAYLEMKNYVGKYLDICIAPSGKITADEIVEYVKKNNYKVVFIDYDSNIRCDAKSDSLYLALGDVYEKFTELTQMGKLIYIASQLSSQKDRDNLEVFELNQLGDSRRKQEIVDVVITGGKVKDSPNHLGCFKVAKNRRGEEGGVYPYIRLDNGRFKIIPRGLYDSLKQGREKKFYTDADIDMMVNQFELQYRNINQQVNEQLGRQTKINNPFG